MTAFKTKLHLYFFTGVTLYLFFLILLFYQIGIISYNNSGKLWNTTLSKSKQFK